MKEWCGVAVLYGSRAAAGVKALRGVTAACKGRWRCVARPVAQEVHEGNAAATDRSERRERR